MNRKRKVYLLGLVAEALVRTVASLEPIEKGEGTWKREPQAVDRLRIAVLALEKIRTGHEAEASVVAREALKELALP